MTHYTNTSNPVDFPQSKIIELWGEALDRGASETYTQMSYSQVLKVKDIFAELIVRECEKRLREEAELAKIQAFTGSEYKFTYLNTAANIVKQHFGIKE